MKEGQPKTGSLKRSFYVSVCGQTHLLNTVETRGRDFLCPCHGRDPFRTLAGYGWQRLNKVISELEKNPKLISYSKWQNFVTRSRTARNLSDPKFLRDLQLSCGSAPWPSRRSSLICPITLAIITWRMLDGFSLWPAATTIHTSSSARRTTCHPLACFLCLPNPRNTARKQSAYCSPKR